MDRITRKMYGTLSCEERREYVTNMLGLQNENQKVGGKVRQKSKERLSIIPYHLKGEPVQIFKNSRFGSDGWDLEIPAPIESKEDNIAEGDYVQGYLIIGTNQKSKKPELRFSKVKKMESFEELKRDLFDALKERWQEEWQRNGFTFDEEIDEFDGKKKFGEWLSKEAAYKLQLSYENFIQEKMDEQKQKLNALQKEEARMKKAMEPLKSQLEEIRQYQRLGILREEPNQPNEAECYDYHGYSQLTDEVWSYLWKRKHLYYEKSTVRCFMNALRTQQLIILWGKPGTGKTSLPRGIAEALGAKCVRVQVQSNWTDNQDLLGFYNIVEKRYVPTQFLEALVEAGKNPNRLYLILLDEMNLSNVEYYFSEMLNVFTWDEAYTLHLYPRKNLEDLKREREFLEAQKKNVSHLDSRLQELRNDYTPDFEIPPNVRFVGTLNADATTKDISPKVIDRSAIIELEAISGETKRRKEEALPALPKEAPALDGERQVLARQFEIRKLPPQEDNPVRPILEKIRECLKEAGLSVSNRLDVYADQWFGWEDSEVTADEIVLEKILPILDMQYDGKKEKTLKKLEGEILKKHGFEKSLKKLQAMEEQAKSDKWIRYWEN